MFELNIRSNLDVFSRQLTDLERRQLPFATALALTLTAQTVVKVEQRTMLRVLDRPTPYTLNSIALRPATKMRLMAEVFFREFAGKGIAGGKYLKPLVNAGVRRGKRSELALRAIGVMRSDEFWVPGRSVSLDAYGNLPSGLMNRILSQIRGQVGVGKVRRLRGNQTRFFVPAEGSALPRGVWERFGTRAIRPVLIFVRQPSYTRIFPFYEIARQTARIYLPRELRGAMQQALRTAR